MPCTDGGIPHNVDTGSFYKERLDKVTNMLCQVFSQIEQKGYTFTGQHMTEEMRAWWSNHKIEDEKRREAEDRRKKLRLEALAVEMKKEKERLQKIEEEIQSLLGK